MNINHGWGSSKPTIFAAFPTSRTKNTREPAKNDEEQWKAMILGAVPHVQHVQQVLPSPLHAAGSSNAPENR